MYYQNPMVLNCRNGSAYAYTMLQDQSCNITLSGQSINLRFGFNIKSLFQADNSYEMVQFVLGMKWSTYYMQGQLQFRSTANGDTVQLRGGYYFQSTTGYSSWIDIDRDHDYYVSITISYGTHPPDMDPSNAISVKVYSDAYKTSIISMFYRVLGSPFTYTGKYSYFHVRGTNHVGQHGGVILTSPMFVKYDCTGIYGMVATEPGNFLEIYPVITLPIDSSYYYFNPISNTGWNSFFDFVSQNPGAVSNILPEYTPPLGVSGGIFESTMQDDFDDVATAMSNSFIGSQGVIPENQQLLNPTVASAIYQQWMKQREAQKTDFEKLVLAIDDLFKVQWTSMPAILDKLWTGISLFIEQGYGGWPEYLGTMLNSTLSDTSLLGTLVERFGGVLQSKLIQHDSAVQSFLIDWFGDIFKQCFNVLRVYMDTEGTYVIGPWIANYFLNNGEFYGDFIFYLLSEILEVTMDNLNGPVGDTVLQSVFTVFLDRVFLDHNTFDKVASICLKYLGSFIYHYTEGFNVNTYFGV